MKTKLFFFLLAIGIGVIACDPYIEDDIDLPALPGEPTFEYVWLDSNTIVVEDKSAGAFNSLWEFGSNIDGDLPNPSVSTLPMDTVFFPKKGVYSITLHIAASDGGGTASKSEVVEIFADGAAGCNPTVELLTGGCEDNSSRTWTFSSVAGAITIGPTPGSTEWYTSPENGLVPEQIDDTYTFEFNQSNFIYDNNGQTINPWEGYEAQDYTQDPGSWIISENTGDEGEDQLILPAGQFMGVRDCGPVYDIVKLTDTELVVESQLIDASGTPQNEGWFTLYFVKVP